MVRPRRVDMCQRRWSEPAISSVSWLTYHPWTALEELNGSFMISRWVISCYLWVFSKLCQDSPASFRAKQCLSISQSFWNQPHSTKHPAIPWFVTISSTHIVHGLLCPEPGSLVPTLRRRHFHPAVATVAILHLPTICFRWMHTVHASYTLFGG